MSLVRPADAAVESIAAGDTVAVGGFVAVGIPEHLLSALGERYTRTGSPGDLTLYHPAAEGDRQGNGVSHLARDGMLGRVIGSHWGFVPQLMERIVAGDVEAYNFPFGAMDHLLRDTAAGKPGTVTTAGLRTFVDPRRTGGKVNDATTEDLVEVVTLDGEEYLFYHAIAPDVALIRGTTADERGNVSMEREALTANMLATAQAAHNADGTVIVQVERVTEAGSLDAREVDIPGIVVDTVVEAPTEDHAQTYGTDYSGALSGEVRPPRDSTTEETPLTARTVIARRAAMELVPDAVVNLGVGVPEAIPAVAAAGGVSDEIIQTVEAGPIGGSPSGGIDFGTASNHDALVSSPEQFDFYDGGGLDIGYLGIAQADRDGNVNVSRFGSRLPGCGGFINITQNAAKVVFCGTLTTGDSSISVGDGRLAVEGEDGAPKFVERVEQVTFSGDYALETDQPVVFVTERAVFELGDEGVTLTEIAPGVDVESDVVDQMAFAPTVADDLSEMDTRLFRAEPMALTEFVRSE
ncbi:acyl CoA:acetate/3-ketoacid CoA transferase [Halococcus qingdaonensis]|uniref:acyl CoA:acetate/3-ketoacid CoA transferase n=1 Tax=Halococcus qingdaonensis TaxID=224402 RepID=UPI002115D998|nr:malonate decarboxylase subunit alpha [Halococcus qingdaonensis]